MEESVQQFKVGDRVKIHWERSPYKGHLHPKTPYRDTGVISRIGDDERPWEAYVSNFDVEDSHFALGVKKAWLDLLPADPAPSEITIGGVRYSLTPVQEAEATPEPKREPKQGEVWKRVGDAGPEYLLRPEQFGDSTKWVRIDGHNLEGKWGVGYAWAIEPSNLTYAFPDLRAAIAAGVLS